MKNRISQQNEQRIFPPSPTRTKTPTPTPKRAKIRSDDGCALIDRNFVTPTPTRTITKTVTLTRTVTKTRTPTATLTPTISPTTTITSTITPTATPTRTVTKTVTPTITATPTITRTNTPTNTRTPTTTPTNTKTHTPTPTNTKTSTLTPTNSQTITPTPTITATQTATPTVTATQTSTPTQTVTNTRTPTQTPTPSITPSTTVTSTPTVTPTPSSITCCEWDGNTYLQFDSSCNNLTIPVLYSKIEPNKWTVSGTLPCGDIFNSTITCDPNVRYTGSSSCINKWTSSLTISCASGLIITGIREVCQCNAPPIWSFIGNFADCMCCTPTPTNTPTPTITRTLTPTPTITSSVTPTPSYKPPICCDWGGLTTFILNCSNISKTISVPLYFNKIMPNYWTSSGTLSCGDTYFMSITCDPNVPYTGPDSCSTKWTANASISCVGGLIISGIATVCQCDVPPVWTFDGNTSNCSCCTPSPSSTPTPTPTPFCRLASPVVNNISASCSSVGSTGSQATVYLEWSKGTSDISQDCMTGYQIQVLDDSGTSGLVGDIIENICIFNISLTNYTYVLTSSDIIRGDGTCINTAAYPLAFRIRSMHFNDCNESYSDSISSSPSAIPSLWTAFSGTYCLESICVTPTPTPTPTITPSITPTQTPEPTSSSTPQPTPQPTPELSYDYFTNQKEINYIP